MNVEEPMKTNKKYGAKEFENCNQKLKKYFLKIKKITYDLKEQPIP